MTVTDVFRLRSNCQRASLQPNDWYIVLQACRIMTVIEITKYMQQNTESYVSGFTVVRRLRKVIVVLYPVCHSRLLIRVYILRNARNRMIEQISNGLCNFLWIRHVLVWLMILDVYIHGKNEEYEFVPQSSLKYLIPKWHCLHLWVDIYSSHADLHIFQEVLVTCSCYCTSVLVPSYL